MPFTQLDAARRERQGRELSEEERNRALQEAEIEIKWLEFPATKKYREALKKEWEFFERKILKGNCKDMAEYLGCVFAVKKVKGLEELIEQSEKKYRQIVNSKQERNR